MSRKPLWKEIDFGGNENVVRQPIPNSNCANCDRVIMSDYMTVDQYFNVFCSKDCLLNHSVETSHKKDYIFERFKTMIFIMCFILQMAVLFLIDNQSNRVFIFILTCVCLLLTFLFSRQLTYTNYSKKDKGN